NRGLVEASGAFAGRYFALAGVVGLVIVVLAVLLRGWRPAAWVAALVVVVELLVLAPFGIYGDRRDPFASNPLVETLDQLMDDEPEARIFGFDAVMFPNVAGAYGLQDVRYLDALNVERYVEYVRTFLSPSGRREWFVGGPYASVEQAFASYLDNPMFDLLGVRWLLSINPRVSTGLALDLANSFSFNPGLDFRVVRAGGDVRFAFFEHADGEVMLPPPPDDAVALGFDYAVDEAAFDSEGHDGVTFSVVGVYDDGTRRVLWEDEYLPGTDPVAPEWRNAVVDLGGGVAELSEVHLVTADRGNSIADWSAWSDLDYLAPGEESARPQLRFAGTAGATSIYENTDAYPRAWVVHSILPVTGQDEALATLQSLGSLRPDGSVRVDELDLRQAAVIEFGEKPSLDVESVSQRLSDCTPVRDDVVTIDKYESNRVAITVDTDCPGFVVLSDTYYPGWEATVNGESTPVYPADLAIRAVEVGPGRSTVVLHYRPASFRIGLIIAALGITGFGAIAGRSRWKRVQLEEGGSSPGPVKVGSPETVE
ncbi:MAG TPA: YfhO family protein, partial [Acidimicrobiia bacterium]|nr:YfhO family protein [Acidimicrobiia bacterium]